MQPTQQQLEEGRRFGEAYVRFLVAMKSSEVVASTVPSVRTPFPEKPAASKASQQLLVTPIEAAKLLSVSPRKSGHVRSTRSVALSFASDERFDTRLATSPPSLEKLRSNS
jgi:hypothetical protein